MGKTILQKAKRCILLWTTIFILVMLGLTWLLGIWDYQFLNWVKYVTMALSAAGILAGIIQLLRKHPRVRILLCTAAVIVIGLVNLWLLVYYDKEEIVWYEGQKMVKLTHSVLLSNWIEYYDYKNIFIRSKQERIFEAHNNCIGEHFATYYYNEQGDLVKEVLFDRKGNVSETKEYS